MPIQDPQPWERLTKAREAKGLSQRALADALKVDPVSVNRWEHGNSRPNWEYLRAISKALSVSIDYLLENDDGDFFDAEETESLLRTAEIIQSKVRKK